MPPDGSCLVTSPRNSRFRGSEKLPKVADYLTTALLDWERHRRVVSPVCDTSTHGPRSSWLLLNLGVRLVQGEG